MEWVIGFFILWLIGTLLGGSSKSKNDSSTTRYVKKKEDIQKANIKPLEDLSKRLAKPSTISRLL